MVGVNKGLDVRSSAIVEKDFNNNKFKPDYYVLARFAEAFAESAIMNKTSLYSASRIDWPLFNRYLNWLTLNGYVIVENGSSNKRFTLSNTGKVMFDNILKLSGYLPFD
jgi:predicted transcriptional regulator